MRLWIGAVQCPHVLDELPELGFVEFGAAGGTEKRRQCGHHAFIGGEVSRDFAPGQGGRIEECLFSLAFEDEELRPRFENRDVFWRWVDGAFQFAPVAGIDAVFASNDQMALGVMHAAHRLGKLIPEELSVVGVDNIAEASHFWPPLTTVHQPLGDAGELAVQELHELIRRSRQARRAAEAEPEMTLLEPTLIVRESSRKVEAPARSLLEQVPVTAAGQLGIARLS